MPDSLTHYNEARNALALSNDIPTIKDIRAKAEALRAYAQQSGQGLEQQNLYAEIRLRAERRAGEVLGEMELNGGRPREKWLHDETVFQVPTLSDFGINKTQSSRWQSLASIPEQGFELYFAAQKANNKEIITKDLLDLAKKYKRETGQEEIEEMAETINETIEAVSENGQEFRALPQLGDFWRLGRHILYCGDTRDFEFINNAPDSSFAFADPPYNANVAEWDSAFEWGHDWLMSCAKVVAVTPGIVSIFEFARATQMPYLWSAACWIDNGMTRGALGFGNWIYAALFSEESIHRGTQDHFRVSIKTSATGETSHKGRKPAEFVAWLMGLYSQEGETVIDPFLGSGTTLLVAEAMGRSCYGGELGPQYCAAIIARWESITSQKAEKIDNDSF